MNSPYKATHDVAWNARPVAHLSPRRSSPIKEDTVFGNDSITSLAPEDLPRDQDGNSLAGTRRTSIRRHSSNHGDGSVTMGEGRHSASCSQFNNGRGGVRQPRKHTRKLQRRGSNRSCNTDISENSFTFSSTKLGQLLSKGGFELQRDFGVESISPGISSSPSIEQKRLSSPRSPMKRNYSRPLGPKPKLGIMMDNDELVDNSTNIEVGRITSPPRNQSVRQSLDMSKTKLGKMLSQSGFKLDKESLGKKKQSTVDALFTPRKVSCTGHNDPRSKKAAHEDLALPINETLQPEENRGEPSQPAVEAKDRITPTMKESHVSACSNQSFHGSLSGSETAPRTSSNIAIEKSLPIESTTKDRVSLTRIGSHSSGCSNKSNLSGSETAPTLSSDNSDSLTTVAEPLVEEPVFVPIQERVPVEVLKARMKEKAAKKQDIIDKIKLLDSKLSTMLTACHEASQKLKMMEQDDDSISEMSDFTDLS